MNDRQLMNIKLAPVASGMISLGCHNDNNIACLAERGKCESAEKQKHDGRRSVRECGGYRKA